VGRWVYTSPYHTRKGVFSRFGLSCQEEDSYFPSKQEKEGGRGKAVLERKRREEQSTTIVMVTENNGKRKVTWKCYWTVKKTTQACA